MNVYKDVSRYLASKGKFGDLTEFVNCIKTSTTTTGQSVNDICDEILILAVATLGNSVSAETNVERLIKLIVSKQAQVRNFFNLLRVQFDIIYRRCLRICITNL